MRPIFTALLAWPFLLAPALAQTVDRDPFQPPPVQERIEAAERDRIDRITSEIVEARLAEVERRVTEVIERRLIERIDRAFGDRDAELERRAERLLDEAKDEIAATRDELREDILEIANSKLEDVSRQLDDRLPEGAVFIACVNERALYRDPSGNTFFFDDPSGPHACGDGPRDPSAGLR